MTPGILTTCASCAAPIPYTAPRCSKCHTRYCGQACQLQHWNTGGHNRALCKRIKRAGGAEKYYADQKYNEAVAEAVEACAEYVPEGATCYICTEAVVQRTEEGLVNGFCACGDRDGVDAGTTGVAHVSCLVREAELAQDDEMLRSFHQDRNERWHTCRLCGKKYHGDVERAMGWAWWRANLSRSPQSDIRRDAMAGLASSLACNGREEEALDIYRATLDIVTHHNPHLRTGSPPPGRGNSYELIHGCMVLQTNIANTLGALGRHDEAIARHRRVRGAWDQMFPEGLAAYVRQTDGSQISTTTRAEIEKTYARERLFSILNLASSLIAYEPRRTDLLHEARSLLLDNMADAQRVLGPSHEAMLMWRSNYAKTFYYDEGASDDDLRKANEIADDIESIARRHLGEYHPLTETFERLGCDSDSESTADGCASESDASSVVEAGTFQRASQETLSERRIVSVSDRFKSKSTPQN